MLYGFRTVRRRWTSGLAALALVRLAAEDKDFIAQVDATSYLPDYSGFLAGAPEVYRTDLHRVRECLLHKPWELGAENLAWLAWNPVMMDGHP